MSAKTRQKILGVILLGSMVWGFFTFFGGGSRTTELSDHSVQSGDSSAIVPHPTGALIDVKAEEARPWGDDPFRPEKRAAAGKPVVRSIGWSLSGIFYNSIAPVAIINGTPVRTGESIGGAVVREIRKSEVVIEHQGKHIKLTVSKG